MKFYYKIIAIHSTHGICTILAYDSENYIIGGSEKYESKEEAYEALKNADAYRSTGQPKYVSNDPMDNLSRYGFRDITIMEFIDLS